MNDDEHRVGRLNVNAIRLLSNHLLIAAMLQALAEDRPAREVEPLTAEIVRRNLVDQLLAEAQRRRMA